jgi:hypothetical protein
VHAFGSSAYARFDHNPRLKDLVGILVSLGMNDRVVMYRNNIIVMFS